MSTGTHQCAINHTRVFVPRERLAVTTVSVAGFTLEVVEDGFMKRHEWTLREGGRLIDSGYGSRHSVALELGTNRLLGCLRRAGAVAQAARIKKARTA